MYSVVLMAALTTTPAVPEFGRRHGGGYGLSGCCGCYGGYGYGCGGYGCGGSGWGCSGCWGGYGYGCSGYGCGGYGCGGCSGYSYPAYTSYLCTGGYYNTGYSGYGCYGGCSGGGYSFGYAPAYIAPTGAPGPNRPAEKIPGPGGSKGEGLTSNINVNVPTGARLFVDGKLTDTASSGQAFTTPQLAPGQMYAYTFRAEVVRNGRTQTDTQRVVFRPGETVRVNFPGLTGNGTQTAQAGGR